MERAACSCGSSAYTTIYLAREYRQRTEVLAGCNEAVDLGAITVEDEERCFQAVLEAREALFCALEELDMLEEEGR